MSELEAKTEMRRLAQLHEETLKDANLSVAEKANKMEQIATDLESQSKLIAATQKAKAFADQGEAPADERAKGGNSLGEQITNSKVWSNVVARAGTKAGSFYEAIDLKTAGNLVEGAASGLGYTGNWGAPITPNFLPGIVEQRFQPLVIADLIPQSSTDSPVISYVKETAFTNSAAFVAEGGAKPQSDDTLARVQENVGKTAHFFKITDEMIQDVSQAQGFMTQRLVLGLKLKEQDALLNGTGSGASIVGLLNRSGLQTAVTGASLTGAELAQKIYNQVTNIRWNAFSEPDAIVVNPFDWQTIRLTQDANDQYYAGGPFSGQYGNGGFAGDSIWGLRVVVTPAITQGTILVGAFADATHLFRRQGVTVEMTNSNQDDFTNNLITVRAEERFGLAVFRPQALGTVTFTA